MVVPREDNLEIDDFRGLDISSHPSLIPDKAFSKFENLHFGENGEVYRRPGLYSLRDFNLAEFPITNQQVEVLGSFNSNASDHSYLFLIGGIPYQADSLAPDSYIPIDGFAPTIACVGVAQWNDTWYFITANDGVWKAPAVYLTTATKIAGSPNAAAFLLFKDRLWLVLVDDGITSANSSVVQWSAAANLDSWPAENIILIAEGDGDIVTNLIPVGDRIMAFKKFSVWNIYTQGSVYPISAIRQLLRGRGAVSTKAIAVVNELIYFIAHDGVWVTDGSVFTEISTPIHELFHGGPAFYGFDQGDFISYDNDHLYIRLTASPTGPPSTHATLQGGYYYLIYNIPRSSWGEEVYPPTALIGRLTKPQLVRNELGSTFLLQGSTSRIFLRYPNYWYDDTAGDHGDGDVDPVSRVPVPIEVQTKRFVVDRKTRTKRLKYMMIGMEGVSSTPIVQYIVDGNARDPFSFDPAAVDQYGSYMLPGCGYFRSFEFNLKDETAQPFRLDFFHFILHLKRNQMESVQ